MTSTPIRILRGPGGEVEVEGPYDAFAASGDRWMVAVRMVSEGVDIPRLAVGVYATSTATPLFWSPVNISSAMRPPKVVLMNAMHHRRE